MQSVAAQNALSGEKTFRTVQFAITGQPEADAIAGIFIVLGQWPFNFRTKQRLLEFMATRMKDDADSNDRLQQLGKGLGGFGAAGQAQSILPGELYPSTTGHTPVIWGNSNQTSDDMANQKRRKNC